MGCIAEAQLQGHAFLGWFLTHDLPIPDCHETVTRAALATDPDAVWYVEEDMIPGPGALTASLALLGDIVVVDYPVGYPAGEVEPHTGNVSAGTFNCVPNTEPIDWSGLGCTLIARHVFQALPQPWFAIDDQWEVWHFGPNHRTFGKVEGKRWDYGGEDVNFGILATRAGFVITKVPGQIAGHALLRSWGQLHTNEGAHTVTVRDVIERTTP
jgi:hypothetical protein